MTGSRLSPEHEERREARRLLIKDIKRVLIILTIFICLALLLRAETVRENLFNIETLRATLQAEHSHREGLRSRGVFLLAGSLLVGVGMPRLFLSTVAGAIYGAVEGTVLALVASTGGATLTFQIGRSLLSSMVSRRLGGRVAVWRKRFREDAIWWVLYGRLLPFTNSTLMNLLCGSCRVPLKQYVLGSLIGFLPFTLIFALFGSAGAKGNAMQIGLGLICLLVSILIQRILRRWRNVELRTKLVGRE